MNAMMNIMTPHGYSYITEVTFHISKKELQECYNELHKGGYTKVDGDIRVGGRKNYVALGYKKENKPPITDIKAIISKSKAKEEFLIGNSIYRMIKDRDYNGDINRGSGGVFIFLYYTTDPNAGQPIKDLIFASYPTKINTTKDVVKNASESIGSGDLDINHGRGGPYNYIFLIR